MPAYTPNSSIPYPVGTDPIRGTLTDSILDDLKEMAVATDAADVASESRLNENITIEGSRAENAAKVYSDEKYGKLLGPQDLPAEADANDYRTSGWFVFRYTGSADNSINFPHKGLQHLHVFSTANNFTYQVSVGYGGNFEMYVRSTASASSLSWSKWEPLVNRETNAIAGMGARRSFLVSEFQARRGGVIGVPCTVVSLRFDHGLAKFKTKILPLLRKYDLPWSQAINSNTLTDASNSSSFAELQGWALNDGGEVWNHGRDHADATGFLGITVQIDTALRALRSSLPGLAIEGWAPPGTSGGTGFDGYSPGSTLENYETYAGRLIISEHAAVAGYTSGIYRNLNGKNEIGRGHTTIEEQTPAWVATVLRGAISAKAGVQLMLHPSLIDSPGYMTTADVEAVFADIAAKRDAGEICVLTPSGMLLADINTDHRHDLLTNGTFKDGLAGWSNTTNWAVTTAGGIRYATTTAGTPLTQDIGFARQQQFLGGARELVYKVRATSGAVVRTSVTGAGLNSAKDRTLPPSPGWKEVRTPFTIPANLSGSLTAVAGRVSGGKVDITDIRVQSI